MAPKLPNPRKRLIARSPSPPPSFKKGKTKRNVILANKAKTTVKQAAETSANHPYLRRPHNRRPVELEIALKESTEGGVEGATEEDDIPGNDDDSNAPTTSAPTSDCDSDDEESTENVAPSSTHKTSARKNQKKHVKTNATLSSESDPNKKKTFYELKAERKALQWNLDPNASIKPKNGGKANLHHCPKSFKGNCRRAKTPLQKRPYCKTHQIFCEQYGVCTGGAEWPRLPNQSCGRCGGW
ncbi:MAG: hypothetical protein M1831_000302 [Alyxoria varia]|nr:MAG: hypothetical protein M1831_000302 [Alyxoria varia]